MQVKENPSRRCSGICDTPCVTEVHTVVLVRREAVTKRSLCFCVALCPEAREGGNGVPFLLFACVSGYLELHFSLHCQKNWVGTHLKGHHCAAWAMFS